MRIRLRMLSFKSATLETLRQLVFAKWGADRAFPVLRKYNVLSQSHFLSLVVVSPRLIVQKHMRAVTLTQ
jgi:hypothetical protein